MAQATFKWSGGGSCSEYSCSIPFRSSSQYKSSQCPSTYRQFVQLQSNFHQSLTGYIADVAGIFRVIDFTIWCFVAFMALRQPISPSPFIEQLTMNLGADCAPALHRSSASPALLVPMTRHRTLGDRDFPVAGVWNSLPATLTSQSSLLTFRQQLKTLLFERSYRILCAAWERRPAAAGLCGLMPCQIQLQLVAKHFTNWQLSYLASRFWTAKTSLLC